MKYRKGCIPKCFPLWLYGCLLCKNSIGVLFRLGSLKAPAWIISANIQLPNQPLQKPVPLFIEVFSRILVFWTKLIKFDFLHIKNAVCLICCSQNIPWCKFFLATTVGFQNTEIFSAVCYTFKYVLNLGLKALVADLQPNLFSSKDFFFTPQKKRNRRSFEPCSYLRNFWPLTPSKTIYP